MKKIRLNENDIERLVKKIIKEELHEGFFSDVGDKIDKGVDKIKGMFRDDVELLLAPGKTQDLGSYTDFNRLIVLITNKYFTEEDAKKLVVENSTFFNAITIVIPMGGDKFDMEKEYKRGNQYHRKIESKLPNITTCSIFTFLGYEISKKVEQIKGYSSSTQSLTYHNLHILTEIGAIG